MTLLAMEGIGRLAREREHERHEFDRYVQLTIDLFEEQPEGIRELDLIDELVSRGAALSVASACADELISGGVARKNWKTGLLTHAKY